VGGFFRVATPLVAGERPGFSASRPAALAPVHGRRPPPTGPLSS
jgi:hypothetical protein